jgi:hypothetical protein
VELIDWSGRGALTYACYCAIGGEYRPTASIYAKNNFRPYSWETLAIRFTYFQIKK